MTTKKKKDAKDADVAARVRQFSLFSTPLTQRAFVIIKWSFACMTAVVIIVLIFFYISQLRFFFNDYYLDELSAVTDNITPECYNGTNKGREIYNCFLRDAQQVTENGLLPEPTRIRLGALLTALEDLDANALQFNISKMPAYYSLSMKMYDFLPSYAQKSFPKGDLSLAFGKFLPGMLFLYGSGFLTAVLMIFAFGRFAEKTTETLQRLWQRGIIRLAEEQKPGNKRSHTRLEFVDFLTTYQKRMDHPAQLAVCIACAALMLWRVLATQSVFGSGGLLEAYPPFFIMEVISQPLTGIIMGAILWRMLIVSLFFLQLGKLTELTPQIDHPDRVGGMAVVGNLFLWNALIFVLPAAFVSVWYAILKGFDVKAIEAFTSGQVPLDQIRTAVFAFFLVIGILLIVTSIVSFFLPLLSIHKEMLIFRMHLQDQLDAFSLRINDLNHQLLCFPEAVSLADEAEKQKQIELVQKIQAQRQRIPTWPYDMPTIYQFIIVQMGPILTLAGVSDSIVKMINSVITAMGK